MNSPLVGCAACGGPIHPIASRCKHCKTDLLKLREDQRRAARLAPPTAAPAPANNNASADTVRPGPTPSSAPPVNLAPNLVDQPPARASFWARRWPIIVGIAAIAIIAISASLLAGGGAEADTTIDGTTSKSPVPMPGMQNPTIPGQGPFGLAPTPSDPGAAPTVPAPPSSNLPGLGNNPFAVKPRNSAKSTRKPPKDYSEFMSAMAVSVCEKMSDCGVIDKSVSQLCDMLADTNTSLGLGQMPTSPAGKTCTFYPDAATDCLDALDGLSCSAVGVDNLLSLAAGMSRCIEAQVCL